MNTTLLATLKHITTQYGMLVLNDTKRLNGLLSDLAPTEPKSEKKTFVTCLMNGFHTELQNTKEDRQLCKNRLAQKLHSEEGLDLTLCNNTLDLLEAVLFGTVTPTAQPRIQPVSTLQPPQPALALPPVQGGIIYCAQCGTQLPNGSVFCSNCGASVQQKLPVMGTPQTTLTPIPALPKKHTGRNVLIVIGVILVGVVVWVMSQYNAPTPAPTSAPSSTPAAASAPAPNSAGTANAVVTPAFVRIEGGTFTMGSPSSEVSRETDEGPHQVTVNSFYMGKYEVTQAEYETVMGTNPSNLKGANLPVESVTWYDAIAYCNRKSVNDGLSPAYTVNGENIAWNRNTNGYRLPTEAEWEYACRAGTTTPFSTGNNITTGEANYDGNYPYNGYAEGTYRQRTTVVGSFSANPWGLYDMHGNVWEWCWDWFGNYSVGAQNNPTGAASGPARVERGGSWGNNAQGLRSAYRSYATPSRRSSNLGFRLVRP